MSTPDRHRRPSTADRADYSRVPKEGSAVAELGALASFASRSACAILAGASAGTAVAATALMTFVADVPVARADSTRALASSVEGTERSIVVVADTSAAATVGMSSRPAFDPRTRYTRAGCAPGRIYWRRGEGPPPDCNSDQWIDADPARPGDGLHCARAIDAIAARGWHAAGRLRQRDRTALQWGPLLAGARGGIECEDDRGRHGQIAGAWYAVDGAGSWSEDARAEIAWDERPERYTLYSSQYVAWWHGSPVSGQRSWRDGQRQAVAAALPRVPGSLTLFRHSWNADGAGDAAAEGGMVLGGPAAGAERTALVDALWPRTQHGGGLPLAETLDEVARYLAGRELRYGLASRAAPAIALPSAPSSLGSPGLYRSPLVATCSRTLVLAMTSSIPSQDAGAALANAVGLTPTACALAVPGECAATFARALADPAPASSIAHTIGRVDVAWYSAVPLQGAGTGRPPEAATVDSLPALAAGRIRARLEEPSIAISADGGPQVAAVVADGSRTWTTWLRPSSRERWLGGLRYAQTGGAGGSAVRGTEVRPRPPAARRLFTDVAGAELSAAANLVTVGNARIGSREFGLDPADEQLRTAVILWARGHDVDDVDADGDRDEARSELGAMPGAPGIVRYAGGRTIVYVGSSDGFLHAFDGADERWAYVPDEFLRALPDLRHGARGGTRRAGIDGDVRVLLADANGDRRIDPALGERAVLLFGLRRGGRAYYAVDVSDPDAPRKLWKLGPRELPGLGQSWASPVPVRLTIANSAQRPGSHVVVLTGGHDPSQDRRTSRTRDRVGAGAYIVDAWSGTLLWHAGAHRLGTRSPDLFVDTMEYAVAATPRALDLDGDGEMDRLYVADTGGQVFRFDFARGMRAGELARAVRLAALGGTGADDRRFYVEPEVALIRTGATPYAMIALGSGFAPNPRDAGIADRLYSLRDTLPDPRLERDTPRLVRDVDLVDATDGAVASGTLGWKRRLTLPGERILSPARIADHRVLVPTWRAPAAAPAPDCTLPPGANRLISVDARDGRPRAFRVIDSPEQRDPSDLPGSGVVPGAAFVSDPPAPGCRARCGPRVTALVGEFRIDLDWPGSLLRSGWVERTPE